MKFSIIVFLCLLVTPSWAQIKGVVSDKQTGEALVGGSVYWLQAKKGTTTNSDGIFELALPARLPDTLLVSYTGYKTDTLLGLKLTQEVVIRLQPIKQLKEVEIVSERAAMSVNTIDPFNKVSLGKAELKKAACCNLSESFETNATVDVCFTDAVSGSKQLKLLGLEGAYSLFTFEQMPGIRGLSLNTGLAHLPGTWIDAIDITKGIGSVVNGYEGISGHVNIELDKPEKSPRWFVNVYAGDAGRVEANVQTARKFNSKWSSMLLTHANSTSLRKDYNKDGYLDVPLGYQFNALNRWKYENTGKLVATFGVQAAYDNRFGGETQYRNSEYKSTTALYGVDLTTKHAEAFAKFAIGFKNQPYKSLGIYNFGRWYNQSSTFGYKRYEGTQKTLHTNWVYQSIIGSTDYKFKTGASFLLDNYRQSYNDTLFNRNELVPGVFGELNYDIPGKSSVLVGVRADYHNLYGWVYTPRVHYKKQLRKYTTWRVSAGRGMHVANYFVEQPAILASNRQLIIKDQLKPELAWNYGTSLTQNFKLFKGNATLLLDIYRTDFENQVIADVYSSAQTITLSNLAGKSYSTSVQSELIYEPIKKLEFRLAYKYQDVKATYANVLLTKPLVAKHRALLNVAYATKFDKWKFDATLKWFGTQQLPTTVDEPHAMHNKVQSPTYYTVNAQITRAFKKWDAYVGTENLFNYMQHHQIADAKNPFGTNFDATAIWGPTMGRVFYTGIRFTIK